MHDALVAVFVGAVVRVLQHVLVVTVMLVVDVLILRKQVHVVDPDVDPQPGLPVPVEIRRLGRVRHVVCRLQIPSVAQIFQENIL